MIRHYEEELSRYLAEADRAFSQRQWIRAEEFLLLGGERLESLIREGPAEFRPARAAQLGEVLDLVEETRDRRTVPNTPQEAKAEKAAASLRAGGTVETVFAVEARPSVTLDDVAGMAPLKALVRLRLIEPFRSPAITRKHGIRPGGGFLLYGPPGTGKTLIARAIAGTIEAAFLSVKASDLLDSLYGSTEKRIAALFRQARALPLAIVFLDELDAIGGDRDRADPHLRRFLTQLLTELDGFSGRAENVFVIGATNRPWLLDPALLRPGRMDECLYVGLPDQASREALWARGVRGRAVAGPIDAAALAHSSAGLSGAEIQRVCERASEDACQAELQTGRETGVSQAALLALIPPDAGEKHRAEVEQLERFSNRCGRP